MYGDRITDVVPLQQRLQIKILGQTRRALIRCIRYDHRPAQTTWDLRNSIVDCLWHYYIGDGSFIGGLLWVIIILSQWTPFYKEQGNGGV
jgi:hypothetical protein